MRAFALPPSSPGRLCSSNSRGRVVQPQSSSAAADKKPSLSQFLPSPLQFLLQKWDVFFCMAGRILGDAEAHGKEQHFKDLKVLKN